MDSVITPDVAYRRTRHASSPYDQHDAAPESDGTDLEHTGERMLPGGSDALTELEHVHRYLLAASLTQEADVLDIGSGEGYGAAALARLARSVIGLDSDRAAVEHARRRYVLDGLRFSAGRAESLPFPDATFDVCVAFEVIEHLESPEAMVREARRVLRPDGLLLLSTPNVNVAPESRPGNNPYHLQAFTQERLMKTLAGYFPCVDLHAQYLTTASFVRPLESKDAGDLKPLAAAPQAEGPRYFLAIAGACDRRPAVAPTLCSDGGDRVLQERLDFWRGNLELKRQLAIADREADRLTSLHREAARRVLELESDLALIHQQRVDVERRAADLVGQAEVAGLVRGSHSWRYTVHLRAAGRFARRITARR